MISENGGDRTATALPWKLKLQSDRLDTGPESRSKLQTTAEK